MFKRKSEPRECECGHVQHSSQGGCLGCLRCRSYRPVPDAPTTVTVTVDEYEGVKNELSFALSELEDLRKKYAALEDVRRKAAQRESGLSRDNFDLMRQRARLESRIECLAGRHGVTVGNGTTGEECKECGQKQLGIDLWVDRPPVRVSLESAPPGSFIGPYVLLTPEERASIHLNWDKAAELAEGYLDQIDELEGRDDSQEIERLRTQLRWTRDRLMRADDLLNAYQEAAYPQVLEADQLPELTDNPPIVDAYHNAGEYFREENEALMAIRPPGGEPLNDFEQQDADIVRDWNRLVQYGEE
jgi:hypothetical protein